MFDSPEKKIQKKERIQMLNNMINFSLSEKQRIALKTVMKYQYPMDVLAEQMGTNRNALYKLIHDARKKFKEEFENKGIRYEDIVEIFS